MPWDTKDYPSSLKNLDPAIRKKAIEIANAMVKDGYEESRAIPIATKQAKEWYENASKQEIKQIKQAGDQELQSHKKYSSSRPELMDKGEHVLAHEDGWAVQAEDAKRPSEVFSKKEEAIDRAREIAKNKQTHLIVHKKDGAVQEKTSYEQK
ncbi:DUF2188 domain-containing protein [Alkalihalobacillus oceani]|uniref:DUF2188 domain-containing protein n=1 Tax=Halalkalibacter oceani TaxID=1653776 RepID=A0A9X2DNG4_9BACI|nr:DUF2188 domain-containing protein [Halalkalibacter oceani]MCM3714146.1 DUF2188 domain-containing protein [Halalkalibacter oceani]